MMYEPFETYWIQHLDGSTRFRHTRNTCGVRCQPLVEVSKVEKKEVQVLHICKTDIRDGETKVSVARSRQQRGDRGLGTRAIGAQQELFLSCDRSG